MPQQTGDGISVVLYPNALTSASVGDLLQLSFEVPLGSPTALVTILLFLPINQIENSAEVTSSGATQQIITVTGVQNNWFRVATPDDFVLGLASPPDTNLSGTQWLVPPQSVTWLTRPDNVDLDTLQWGIDNDGNTVTVVLDALRSQAGNIVPGSWLRIALTASSLPSGAKELWLMIDQVRGSSGSAAPGSPAGGDEVVQIIATGAWWALDDSFGWSLDLSNPRVDVVTLQLWVRDVSGKVTTISNLGLSPLHPRYIGYLPTDSQLYSQTATPSTPPWSELLDDVDHPRFALASPDFTNGSISNEISLPLFIPLGVPGLVDQDFYQPAAPQSGTALQRDGLALQNGQLMSDLFLDPDLADSTVDTLLTAAFHKQYQLQRVGDSIPGEPLLKMHSLLPVEEISILALPDAMHPGWQLAPAPSGNILAGPDLVSVSISSEGQLIASWTMVSGATSYLLQQSGDPQFASGTVVWEGLPVTPVTSPFLLQSAPFDQPAGCPKSTYFRVRAAQGELSGPWSNTLSQTLPVEAFEQCQPGTLMAPFLEILPETPGRVVLQWDSPQNDVDGFELQVAYEPGFVLPEIVFEGTDSQFELWVDPSRTAYFHVSATRSGAAGPWSNTCTTQPNQSSNQYWMNVPPPPGDLNTSSSDLLKIHQAMIRFCAARADTFALLGMPRQYDAPSCILYKNLLTASLFPENGDTTLSFAAAYFPWLVVLDAADDSPGAIRSVSPEGSIAGTMAALSLSSGAWFAPANQLLPAAVDLDQQLGDGSPESFFANQLNLMVQEASGFLTMSSFTLSPSTQLTQINVRRLLILLRRLALREGNVYVFQPNDSTFWRRVQRRFQDILGSLFLRGAFAGATQDESFAVRADSSLNTQSSVDQGQFIVEIRVAPSLPLEFLTVRLLQQGGDLTFSEEF